MMPSTKSTVIYYPMFNINKYIVSAYHMSGTVLDSENKVVNKDPVLRIYNLEEEKQCQYRRCQDMISRMEKKTKQIKGDIECENGWTVLYQMSMRDSSNGKSTV
jgi:hypothetical protein